MFTKVVMMVSILLLLVIEMKAQDGLMQNTGIGIGPQLGYQKAKDADKGNLMYGLDLRLRLTQALGIDGSINYRQEKYGNGAITVKSWPIMASVLFYPLPIIYGLVGGGWYNTTFDYGNSVTNGAKVLGITIGNETVQKFGWHLGAGLEFDAGSNMKVYGDIKYVFLNYSFNSLATQAVNSLNNLSHDFYVINVGLLFGF